MATTSNAATRPPRLAKFPNLSLRGALASALVEKRFDGKASKSAHLRGIASLRANFGWFSPTLAPYLRKFVF